MVLSSGYYKLVASLDTEGSLLSRIFMIILDAEVLSSTIYDIVLFSYVGTLCLSSIVLIGRAPRYLRRYMVIMSKHCTDLLV